MTLPEAARKTSKLGPCVICGSTRSQRGPLFGDYSRVACYANADGRDRCREREMRKADKRSPSPKPPHKKGTMTMDSQTAPSPAYCIRWEPAGDPEAAVYITLKTALDRLTRDEPDTRDTMESLLLRGGIARTPFAFYQMADVVPVR